MERSERPRGKFRNLLMIMLALSTVAILAVVAMLLLSDFPGQPEGAPNKTEAPPEDVTR